MPKTHAQPPSITLLGWHLSHEDPRQPSEPRPATSAKLETWPEDFQHLPVPSLLLCAS